MSAPGASTEGDLQNRIGSLGDQLSSAERRVAEYIQAHSADAIFLSALDLAQLTGTSDATVIRTAKRLHYSGLAELKHELASVHVARTHPTKRLQARLARSRGADPDDTISTFVEESKERLDELQASFSAQDFARAVELLGQAGHVVTFGVGVSGVVADYLATRLNRLGQRASVANSMGFALADDLLSVQDGDVVVVFDPARVMRELTVILEHCAAVGADTILITDTLQDDPHLRATVALRAPDSLSGYTGEVLTSLVLADALLLTLGQGMQDRAKETSRLLNRLRRKLSGTPRPRRR